MSQLLFSPELRRALRRSRVRVEILLALHAFGRSSIGDIERLTGVEPENLRGALFGDHERYRLDHSLVGMLLVEVVETESGRTYALTRSGESVAEDLRVALMGQLSRRARARV